MKILVCSAKEKISLLISLLGKILPSAEIVCMEDIVSILTISPDDWKGIDITFVDNSLDDVDKALGYFYKNCDEPTVLLIDKDNSEGTDWEKVFDLGLYGCLRLSDNTQLVSSSLKAMLRRLPGYIYPDETGKSL